MWRPANDRPPNAPRRAGDRRTRGLVPPGARRLKSHGLFLFGLLIVGWSPTLLGAEPPTPGMVQSIQPGGTTSSGLPNPSGGAGVAPPASPDGVPSLPPLATPTPPVAFPYSYSPGGRRDPFAVIIPQGLENTDDRRNLPPLQRVGLSELTLIGIIWGGFGYTAMVQTADGKGYSVRPGTHLGSNNGVVDSITSSAVIVRERNTDVYGHRQTREIVMRLHPKEGQE